MSVYRPTASFARPEGTTQYGAGDLVANSGEAGDVVPLAFATPHDTSCLIRAVSLFHSDADVTNSAFRVWILSEAPAVTNGDNGALAGVSGAAVLGTVEIAADENCGATFGQAEPVPILVSGPFYALIEATAAYTPASEETFGVAVLLESAE